MFCTACGQLLQSNVRFCHSCGTPAATATPPGNVSVVPAGVMTPDGFRRYATFGPRLGAYLIDGVITVAMGIVAAILVLLGILIAVSGDIGDGSIDALFSGMLVVIQAGYRWWGNATGRSLGKRVVGIRIVREETGAAPGLGYGFVRLLVEMALGVLSLLFLFLPSLINYLSPLWDAKRQTIHDKAAGTVVVHDAIEMVPASDYVPSWTKAIPSSLPTTSPDSD